METNSEPKEITPALINLDLLRVFIQNAIVELDECQTDLENAGAVDVELGNYLARAVDALMELDEVAKEKMDSL